MCNDECDFNCVSKYKPKRTLFEKIMDASVLVLIWVGITTIIVGAIHVWFR